jgi:hypothetical protein
VPDGPTALPWVSDHWPGLAIADFVSAAGMDALVEMERANVETTPPLVY